MSLWTQLKVSCLAGMTNGSLHLNGNHPMLLKRMSPIPGRPMSSVTVTNSLVTRGQSPVARNTAPMMVSNSVEAQQQVAQQMQQLTIFSSDNNQEPPPPYPMGPAAMSASPAPPSYSQTLAMRQSPTLSSTSSNDYRRSPLPQGLLHSNFYPNVMMAGGHAHLVTPTPTSPLPAAPSPVNSILSSSSRSSMSSAAWSARQAKTQSPIIMQSVRSTQVQKPVLQQAMGVANQQQQLAEARLGAGLQTGVCTGVSVPPPPPPSYNESMQKKTAPSPVPGAAPGPPAYNVSVGRPNGELPPPPPYPSTQVSGQRPAMDHEAMVMARQSPVINTAKVTVTTNANLARPGSQLSQASSRQKYSPHLSEASSRSDSPSSEPSTIPASPVIFQPNNNNVMEPHDSGVGFTHDTADQAGMAPPPPPYKTVINTSPKPERKTYSREQDEIRLESKIKKYPPSAFKFYMEQHVENVIKYYEDRRKRRMQLEQEMMAMGYPEDGQDTIRKMLSQKESNYLRLKRAKIDKTHFTKIKTIGLGAFGEVSLVRKKDDGQYKLYAMKTLKKSEVLMRNQVAHVKAERDILAEADNDWIVKLYHSFQVGFEGIPPVGIYLKALRHSLRILEAAEY